MKEDNLKHSQNDIEKMIERCKYGLDQVNRWIENADQKISVSCGLFTGIFGIITYFSSRVTETSNICSCCWHIYLILFVCSFIVMSAAITFYVIALNPNLGSGGKKDMDGRKEYPIFYGDIRKYGEQEYKEKISKSKDELFLDELLSETHYNSGICIKKMRRFKVGLWLSFASVFLAFASWIVRCLMYQ